jgi:M6 family metalloprotease-like protein
MRDYFYDVSYAKLDVNGATYGWIRLPKTFEYYNYYTEDSSHPHFNEFINDVITLSDPIVNYANHDGDNDGYIDGIIIIYAGPLPPSSQWAKGLWPCMTWLNYDLDGKKTDTCTVQSEYKRDPGDTNIGVFCHEYSHTLGARDFYDYDFDSKGLGIWSLMSDGWSKQYIDPWHRYYMGWVTPVDVSSSNTYTVNQAENVTEDNTVYRVWIKPPNEYFLLENRQKLWWDSVLPGSGLLIYHIDEAVTTNNDKQWYPGYTSFGHYFCALEQADGNFDLEKNVNWGDSGDPWPGSTNKTSFNTDTTPNTFGYNGQDNIISFSNITNNGSTVSVNINVSTPFVTLLYPNGGETLTAGSTVNVTWTISGDLTNISRISVNYTTDNGKTWNYAFSVSSGFSSSMSNSWTVPNVSSTQCKLRIGLVRKDNSVSVDYSDNVFTIQIQQTPPTVHLTYPNGGETLTAGSTINVTWTISGDLTKIDHISVDYTTDNGTTWKSAFSVSSGFSSSMSNSWTVPNVSSTQCKLKVALKRKDGKWSVDYSDSTFTIKVVP